MYSAQNLIWIDLEMTGLDTDNDLIIEMATSLPIASSISLLKGQCWRFIRPMRYWLAWMSGIRANMAAVV